MKNRDFFVFGGQANLAMADVQGGFSCNQENVIARSRGSQTQATKQSMYHIEIASLRSQ